MNSTMIALSSVTYETGNYDNEEKLPTISFTNQIFFRQCQPTLLAKKKQEKKCDWFAISV